MSRTDTAPSDETRSPSNTSLPRQGWEEQYQRMAENGDDALLNGNWSLTEWDEAEWEW